MHGRGKGRCGGSELSWLVVSQMRVPSRNGPENYQVSQLSHLLMKCVAVTIIRWEVKMHIFIAVDNTGFERGNRQ